MSVYTLYHTLCDAGFDPARVSKAIDVLDGTADPEAADNQDPAEWGPEWDEYRWVPTEPYEPTAEDLAELAEWSARVGEHDRWLDHLDEMPATYPDDRDIMAAGLPIG